MPAYNPCVQFLIFLVMSVVTCAGNLDLDFQSNKDTTTAWIFPSRIDWAIG